MTKREGDELSLIENNIAIDLEAKTAWFRYPLMKDPALLRDNRSQVIAMETKVQERLIRDGLLETYNDVVRDYIDRGVFRKISKEEMDAWDGPVNYVTHHGVAKPDSISTALRVVCNSSLDNHGVSLNDLLPKGPNSLVPLL